MEELKRWLDANKIIHNSLDEEVLEIPDFGKLLYVDTEEMASIFRTDKTGEIEFNSPIAAEELLSEEIFYVAFKFGDNWYYSDLREDFELRILKYIGKRRAGKVNVPFANLGVHTPYELLNGSFMPSEWVKKAKFMGHTALGICDRNTMAAQFSFQQTCLKNDVTPIFGYSLTVNDGTRKFEAKVYVQSQEGLRNLLRIQKAIMVDSEDNTIMPNELLQRGRGNVLVLGKLATTWMQENLSIIETLLQAYDAVYYQVDLSEYKAERIDIEVLKATKAYFEDEVLMDLVPPILISDCYYLDKEDFQNKIILNKVAEGAAHEQSDDQYFKDVDEHFNIFQQLFDSEKWDVEELFRMCCAPTVEIANNASARYETSRNFMPRYDLTEEEKTKYGNSHNMFSQLLEEGLNRLVPKSERKRYRKQMEYEKYIIESTDNVDYLLVQYDTVNWCRKNDILVGCGRGSAAGSLLLYLLGITLVDPLKYNLIFERFLLPERAGLYPAQTTIIGQDIKSNEFVAIELENGKTLNLDKDAELMVVREDENLRVFADELQEGDDVLFDHRDEIFTLDTVTTNE